MIIFDPYEGIDYNEINVYEIEKQYCSDAYEYDYCINAWMNDGFHETGPEESEVSIPFSLEQLKR